MSAPRLTRTAPAPLVGQVHLGPGAFFRAFNAVYTEDAMAAEGGDWGIVAVSLRSDTARDQMTPQAGAYTSVTLGTARATRVIGAVTQVLVAPEDPEAVLCAMTDPGVRVVSLTITEKGYCIDATTGGLNAAHPDIVHDLANPDTPHSAIGFLVAALGRRRASRTAPFTVLSCDNLPSNGGLTRAVVLDFARALDPELATWIDAQVPFPATMVDRITPATTDDDVADLAETAGYFDPACVVHEAFRQWVIEDDFVDGRPAWEAAGAQLVNSVEAHELMKLRCLNGTHSTLAYLGYLAGYETISDTVACPDFARLCEIMWRDEIIPTVPPPEGEDLTVYCTRLMQRYRDPAIRHRTWQIAMDGSQKLPQRLLGTIADTLATGRVSHGLCLAVAGWMRYVGGVDEAGQPIDVRDPMAEQLKAAATVGDLLALKEIFPPDLARHGGFREAVAEAYAALERDGTRATVRAFVQARG
ncbi:mannitol dehydrogenase family protein [Gymnodinialimonas ulvae]|uniref:mannitol dehydrogenase family protein n=1 Tax=Gymnodinialimonas ulvae TaxID=3126504 RepID=UPI0030B5F468